MGDPCVILTTGRGRLHETACRIFEKFAKGAPMTSLLRVAAQRSTPWLETNGPLVDALTQPPVWPRFNAASNVGDADSLRRLVASALAGDQIIAVSNRAPYTHERVNGVPRITQPASGLVTAVEPVVRACAGSWIAHGSGAADHEFVDAADVWQAPPAAGGFRLRRVWLTPDEQLGYRDGFSNAGLWPLCHMAHVRPSFVQRDWLNYRLVNRRFADAVVREARCADPVVLVHDYHLALVPAMLRSQLPDATIVSFWHIPWAHPEQMDICPWLPQIVEGLLGSDIVGFQTPPHQNNFLDSVERCGNDLSDRGRQRVVAGRGHTTQVAAYPISIAWPSAAQMKALPSIEHCRSRARSTCSLRADGKLIVGVDRFDYTKGLVERLHAIETLLESHPQWQGRVRLVQVASPTRTTLPDYAGFRQRVFAEVDRINLKFGAAGPGPILLLDAHHDRAAVNELYRAADLCLVTSLHDGMNLVCKEFVAARDDEQGVLVLSQFAGAALELSEALIVNPYHTAQVADALHCGLSMASGEQRRRMRSLRATVKSGNVHRWAANMLLDAAALRASRVERSAAPLPTRLSSRLSAGAR